MRAPALIPGIEVPQLDAQHSRLKLVQAGVDTHHLVFVFARRSMVSQHADPIGNVRRIRGDGACVSIGAKVLRRVETEGSGVTHAPCSTAPSRGAMGLAS